MDWKSISIFLQDYQLGLHMSLRGIDKTNDTGLLGIDSANATPDAPNAGASSIKCC